jgi:3-hydroxyisobutyrate dehydrogenase-like beta-hydroxyacid dehydrogenase
MNQNRIGFIGLGNMGGRMTRRLVDAGIAVLGFDTVADRIAAAGAQPGSKLRDVMAFADVMMMSLPDSKVVEAVVATWCISRRRSARRPGRKRWRKQTIRRACSADSAQATVAPLTRLAHIRLSALSIGTMR